MAKSQVVHGVERRLRTHGSFSAWERWLGTLQKLLVYVAALGSRLGICCFRPCILLGLLFLVVGLWTLDFIILVLLYFFILFLFCFILV
ncbi:hypothetical protein ES319_A03G174400v1 [Gossypium barbadense]|uniref:Uncharacterized protein n=2 Tax=Gossypium TaxID=3633 RepID=A0A5J5WG32_GOSBA|nr:hypothetical protein ES319_A03G174400v1 [Gossypium barbadense]TYH25788.1 hypothetical protein ES288_A03G197500v1 [Gossypium darwinii]